MVRFFSTIFLSLIYFAGIFASFPSNFGPKNCTDPNEEYHECIGICPGSSHWRDLTCAQLLEAHASNRSRSQQQHLELPVGLGRPLCFSLRCFPGCRCRKGFVREFEEEGGGGHDGQKVNCVNEEKCGELLMNTRRGNGTTQSGGKSSNVAGPDGNGKNTTTI